MIGYTRPIFAATVPVVAQDFDFVHEMNDTTIFGQVKCRSLEDYDFDRPNDDNDWLPIALERWGDRRVSRLARI